MSLTRDVDSEKTERTYTTKHGTKATMKAGNIGRNKPAHHGLRGIGQLLELIIGE